MSKILSLRKRNVNGSLSLEAAISVPVFMLFCIALISFLILMGLQMDIQTAMEETARSMGKKAYALERISSGSGDASEIDQETMNLVSVGINPTVIKIWMLSTDSLGSRLDRSRILGGSGGLYTYESSYDSSEGILDIVAHYDYSVPWLPKYFGTLRLVQRMRSHVWVGRSLTKEQDSGGGDGHTVYVTETGTVYHLSPDCGYLDLSVRAVSFSDLSSARNKTGAKYYRCEECAKSGDYSTVYITDYGTCWHSSLNCSGLKRTILEKDISDIGNMRPCSKCGAGVHSENSH